MAEDFKATSRREAEQIATTLTQLDMLLASEKLTDLYASDAGELRTRVSDLLAKFRTNLENLAEVDRADVFQTDPTLANRRFVLIGNIEAAKISFETEAVPALDRLLSRAIEHAKASPPVTLDVSALPQTQPEERWTVEKVVDAAERLVDQGTKAAGVATKGYALVKALGLLVGIPVP
jgi:hypothetical protein